ncbi:MAG: FecR domain-containing protein [Halofilum sp. (in: g-proteobacteria)]
MDAHNGRFIEGAASWMRSVRWACIPVLLLIAVHAAAAEPAGRVISIAGSVEATEADGPARALEHGDPVFAGETLVLGPSAHAQVRMRDDALLELEADTRFVIERYEPGADGGNVLMHLLRGAMRTITGAIGDPERERYRVNTPVATIGIRGTQYALHFCTRDCAGEERPAGLYGRVDAGAVAASNDAASRVFQRNQYFYVADTDVAPREIVRPPKGILDGGAVSSGELSSPPDGALTGGDSLEGAVGDTTEALGDTVTDVGTATGDAVGELGGAVGDTIGGSGGEAIGSLSDGAGDGVGELSGGLGGSVEALGDDDLDGSVDSLTEGTGDTLDELTDGTDDALEDATDGLEDLLGD